MPPTGVQWTSSPPRPAGTVAAAADLGAGGELGQRVGQAVGRLEAARDDGELPRARAQQRCGRRARAAAGTEHDGALRHLRERRDQAEPVGQIAAQRAVRREAERVDGARVARLVAELVAERDGGGLVRHRDVDAVDAERRAGRARPRRDRRARRAVRRRRGRARAPPRPRCACAASASARPGRRSRRRRASRRRRSGPVWERQPSTHHRLEPHPAEELCRVRLLEVLEVGERASRSGGAAWGRPGSRRSTGTAPSRGAPRPSARPGRDCRSASAAGRGACACCSAPVTRRSRALSTRHEPTRYWIVASMPSGMPACRRL